MLFNYDVVLAVLPVRTAVDMGICFLGRCEVVPDCLVQAIDTADVIYSVSTYSCNNHGVWRHVEEVGPQSGHRLWIIAYAPVPSIILQFVVKESVRLRKQGIAALIGDYGSVYGRPSVFK